jgi:beta-glucosidase-like glycosyl hydrolase
VNTPARLVFPALRWRSDSGYDHESQRIDAALHAGVGGFCIFGGTVADTRALTTELRRRSRTPLLFASDLERGAGQQLVGATQLPPLAAIGSLDDLDVTRRAAALTAREALASGIDWIYAPVADVDLEPRNPIVGTRSFGSDPAHVARHVEAWIRGCRDAGALCCAKHFPGHGRTVADSHATLPRVPHSRVELEADLLPFRAAIAAGVDSMMSAHVVFEALDGSTAATFSRAVVVELARRELGFTGMLVTDALNMAGSLQAAGGSEGAAAVAALRAGCDALLYPDDLAAVVDALSDAAADAALQQRSAEALNRLAAAVVRREASVQEAAVAAAFRERDGDGAEWADSVAARSLIVTRGAPRVGAECVVAIIDDDLSGPFAPPAREPFLDALRAAGVSVRTGGADGVDVIALYSDIRAWKGAPGLRTDALSELDALLHLNPDATIVLFSHPRLAQELKGRHILAAWGGEAIMQRAAAERLTRR